MQLKVKGMHTATKKLADGRVTYYAYAWRKGPLIARATAGSKDAAFRALQADLATPEALAKLSAAREVKSQKAAPTIAYISGLVLAYLKSPEYSAKKPRTRADYRRHLNLFRDEFGDWRTALFEDPRIAQDLAEWRDGFNSQRQGHMQIQTISILFGWARSRGMTKASPTEAIKKVYSADRSAQIWLPDQVQSVLAKSPEPLQWAIKLAVETGLRQGDLITLPWSAISDMAIQTNTSKRDRPVLIPITKEIRSVLSEIPKRSPTVLTSNTGRPWTESGLRSSFDRAKKRAGIEGLTWHDFRGTAVTRLYSTGLTLRDLSRTFGWSESYIEGILTRYVSADEVAKQMLNRISTEQKLQTE